MDDFDGNVDDTFNEDVNSFNEDVDLSTLPLVPPQPWGGHPGPGWSPYLDEQGQSYLQTPQTAYPSHSYQGYPAQVGPGGSLPIARNNQPTTAYGTTAGRRGVMPNTNLQSSSSPHLGQNHSSPNPSMLAPANRPVAGPAPRRGQLAPKSLGGALTPASIAASINRGLAELEGADAEEADFPELMDAMASVPVPQEQGAEGTQGAAPRRRGGRPPKSAPPADVNDRQAATRPAAGKLAGGKTAAGKTTAAARPTAPKAGATKGAKSKDQGSAADPKPTTKKRSAEGASENPKGAKKAKIASGPADEKPKRKRGPGGRNANSKNYGDEEVDIYLTILEDILPIGGNRWKLAAERYNEWATDKGYPNREPKALKTKYNKMVTAEKPTGNPELPEQIERAKKIDMQIEELVSQGTAVVFDSADEEEDDEDDDSEVSDGTDEDAEGEDDEDVQIIEPESNKEKAEPESSKEKAEPKKEKTDERMMTMKKNPAASKKSETDSNSSGRGRSTAEQSKDLFSTLAQSLDPRARAENARQRDEAREDAKGTRALFLSQMNSMENQLRDKDFQLTELRRSLQQEQAKRHDLERELDRMKAKAETEETIRRMMGGFGGAGMGGMGMGMGMGGMGMGGMGMGGMGMMGTMGGMGGMGGMGMGGTGGPGTLGGVSNMQENVHLNGRTSTDTNSGRSAVHSSIAPGASAIPTSFGPNSEQPTNSLHPAHSTTSEGNTSFAGHRAQPTYDDLGPGEEPLTQNWDPTQQT